MVCVCVCVLDIAHDQTYMGKKVAVLHDVGQKENTHDLGESVGNGVQMSCTGRCPAEVDVLQW